MDGAGALRSEDDGASWQQINRGVADEWPEGHRGRASRVHKMVLHPAWPATLFQQHHTGIYRSDDDCDSWRDISDGLPSPVGFPLGITCTIPTQSTSSRMYLTGSGNAARTDGSLARRDGGKKWEALT